MVESILSTNDQNLQTISCFKDERRRMNRYFRYFLHNLILENATRRKDYWSLFVNDLDYEDKKLFLSYLVDSDTYLFLTKNKTRELEAISEYEQEMQNHIDNSIDDIYHEYQNNRDPDGFDLWELT